MLNNYQYLPLMPLESIPLQIVLLLNLKNALAQSLDLFQQKFVNLQESSTSPSKNSSEGQMSLNDNGENQILPKVQEVRIIVQPLQKSTSPNKEYQNHSDQALDRYSPREIYGPGPQNIKKTSKKFNSSHRLPKAKKIKRQQIRARDSDSRNIRDSKVTVSQRPSFNGRCLLDSADIRWGISESAISRIRESLLQRRTQSWKAVKPHHNVSRQLAYLFS